jgi:hypothetical protein
MKDPVTHDVLHVKDGDGGLLQPDTDNYEVSNRPLAYRANFSFQNFTFQNFPFGNLKIKKSLLWSLNASPCISLSLKLME